MTNKMDSASFRKRALVAVDYVGRFIEEFPDLYCVMRIGDKATGVDVIVGTMEAKEEPTDD